LRPFQVKDVGDLEAIIPSFDPELISIVAKDDGELGDSLHAQYLFDIIAKYSRPTVFTEKPLCEMKDAELVLKHLETLDEIDRKRIYMNLPQIYIRDGMMKIPSILEALENMDSIDIVQTSNGTENQVITSLGDLGIHGLWPIFDDTGIKVIGWNREPRRNYSRLELKLVQNGKYVPCTLTTQFFQNKKDVPYRGFSINKGEKTIQIIDTNILETTIFYNNNEVPFYNTQVHKLPIENPLKQGLQDAINQTGPNGIERIEQTVRTFSSINKVYEHSLKNLWFFNRIDSVDINDKEHQIPDLY